MKRILIACIVGCALGLITAEAEADDIFAPDWRGQPGTVMAEWDFWGIEGAGPRRSPAPSAGEFGQTWVTTCSPLPSWPCTR